MTSPEKRFTSRGGNAKMVTRKVGKKKRVKKKIDDTDSGGKLSRLKKKQQLWARRFSKSYKAQKIQIVKRVKKHKKLLLILKNLDDLEKNVVRFIKKNRNFIRPLAYGSVLLIVFSTIAPLMVEWVQGRQYVLNERAEKFILEEPSPYFASFFEDDYAQGKILYNDSYTPSQLGAGAQPEFVASFDYDSRAGYTITDPVNSTSITVKPKYSLKNPQQDENRIIYPLRGMEGAKVLTVDGFQVKEDIILDEYQGDTLSFAYELEMPEGVISTLENDGSISFYGVESLLLGNVTTSSEADKELLQKARENGEKTNLLFRIPAPVVYEEGRKRSSAEAEYQLDGNIITLTARGLDKAQYPLSVDPSIYIETARKLMRGNNETNIDFDQSNELIKKSFTTGARFDEWNSTMGLNEGRWNQGTVTAGGFIYAIGGEGGPTVTKATYSTPGSDTYVVPAGVTSITVKMWGAGGGGGGAGTASNDGDGGDGGGGGFAEATLSVTPLETLNVIVGGGGGAGDYSSGSSGAQSGDGGGGGGHSEVNRSGTNLIIAPGGGGGGGGDNSSATDGGDGGAGGGSTGVSGGSSGSAPGGGGGGTGSGGSGGNGSANDGSSGGAESGGDGANGGPDNGDGDGGKNNGGSTSGGDGGNGDDGGNGYGAGGGGGSGRYGGGGGSGSIPSNAGGGGGGGGSSYVTGTSTTETAGSGTVPGNSSDGDRDGAGEGGTGGSAPQGSGTDGTDGLVVITYTINSGTGAHSDVYWAQLSTTDNSIESPNPGSGTCTSWCTDSDYDLPDERTGFSLVAYNGFLYVIGGEDDTGTRQDTVYISKLGVNGEPSLWHPTDDDKSNWVYWYESANTLTNATSYGAAAAYNNRLYFAGGQTNSSSGGVNAVYSAEFDPTGDIKSWSTSGMVVLPSVRHMHTLHVYNDTMYLIGGNSSGTLQSSVHYTKIDNDGDLNTWQTSESFDTARATWGGNYSLIWGGYIYLAGGCSAINGSGYCTTVQDDVQLVSINADGSLDKWISVSTVSNDRMGYGFVAWDNGVYRIGGCYTQDTSGGDCDAVASDEGYGVINPAGEVSTVNISEASGVSPCNGGSPTNCDLPPPGDDAGEGGQLLTMSVILNGYLYVIGGCIDYDCNGTNPAGDDDDVSGNVSYVSIAADGSLEAPSTCSGTSYGAWCVDSTNRVNGTTGVAAGGVATFNNRIYIVGGLTGSNESTNIYYNSTNTNGSLAGSWSSVDLTTAGIAEDIAYTYAYARANPSSAGTNPGNLYVFGGCGNASSGAGCSNSDYETEVYKCNITTSGSVSGCTTSGQLQIDSTPGTGGTDGLGIHSGTVYANYIFLVGGYSQAESDKDDVLYAKFDDNNDVVAVSGSDWIESSNKLSVGRRRGWAFGYNGHIYAVGGYDQSGTGIIPFIEWSKMNVSDGSIDPFVTSAVTINQRWGLSMVVSNSYAYVIGGCDVGASPGSCSSFEPSVQTFQLYNNDSGTVDDFTAQSDQTFSTDTDRWGASAAIKDGTIYVAGGCTSATDCTSVTDDVQYASIDPADGSVGTWASLDSLPAARAWGYLGLAGGDLYYVGGEDAAGDEKSDVYYVTPTPGGAGSSGEIEHYSARRTSQQTKSSSGWSSVSGTADSGTTASTNGFVDSTNLTVGEDYLVMVWAEHNGNTNSEQSGVRVTHGATPFTESQSIEENDRTGAAYKTPYFWFTVWTAVSGEDLEVEYYGSSTDVSRVEDVTMLVMNAEDLISDGDLQYDIDTAGGTLDTSFTSKASITWTPGTASDNWWIMGYVQGDTIDTGNDKLEYQLNIDSGTVRSTASIEGEDATDTPLYGIGWVEPFSAASHTVDLEIRESAADMEWDASGIFALNLDVFNDYAEYSDPGDGTTLTTVNTYVEQGAVNPTISVTGDVFVAAGGVTDDDNRRVLHRLQLGGTDMTDEVGGWQMSSDDKVPATLADMQINYASGSMDIDYDAQYTSGSSSVNIEDRWVVAFTMEQAAGSGTWSTASNGLPGDRTRFGAAVWNDRIYVVGGLDNSASETATVYVSPQLSSGGDITSAWSSSTSFDVARQGHAVTAYANNLYLFGGYDGSNYLSDVQFTQINSDGSVDAWTYTTNLAGPLRDARAVSANGYIYLMGGRTAASTCNPKTIITPISANTTIATGNNPTGVGEWYETNVRYTGDRYGAAVAYDEGKIYTMGGGCSSPLSSNRHYESSVNSQPQVAKYSRLIDTDTDVFPNKFLMNGIDNSIGARWEVKYTSSTDATSAWGQETDFGEVTLGTVNDYTPRDGAGTDTEFARFIFFWIEIDASKTFGYPDDVTRGPTINDITLYFTADPSKRLRHGKTFTGGEKQPLDTPPGP